MDNRTEHVVYDTTDRCFRCGTRVLRLEPPIQGWSRYCWKCVAMTMTAAQMEASAHEPLPAGAVGRVCQWPLKQPLRIEPLP